MILKSCAGLFLVAIFAEMTTSNHCILTSSIKRIGDTLILNAVVSIQNTSEDTLYYPIDNSDHIVEGNSIYVHDGKCYAWPETNYFKLSYNDHMSLSPPLDTLYTLLPKKTLNILYYFSFSGRGSREIQLEAKENFLINSAGLREFKRQNRNETFFYPISNNDKHIRSFKDTQTVIVQ